MLARLPSEPGANAAARDRAGAPARSRHGRRAPSRARRRRCAAHHGGSTSSATFAPRLEPARSRAQLVAALDAAGVRALPVHGASTAPGRRGPSAITARRPSDAPFAVNLICIGRRGLRRVRSSHGAELLRRPLHGRALVLGRRRASRPAGATLLAARGGVGAERPTSRPRSSPAGHGPVHAIPVRCAAGARAVRARRAGPARGTSSCSLSASTTGRLRAPEPARGGRGVQARIRGRRGRGALVIDCRSASSDRASTRGCVQAAAEPPGHRVARPAMALERGGGRHRAVRQLRVAASRRGVRPARWPRRCGSASR